MTVEQFFLVLYFVFSVKVIQSSLNPLILTPYIQSGQILKARDLSFVADIKPRVPSFSGFLTVDKNCNSNLFFWFFPSRNQPLTDPVTVWLNGGPGLSSMFGLFVENGPYVITKSNKLKLRKYSWTAFSSVIYVDNPVGTGFSFTKNSKDCYSTNQTHLAYNFIVFIQQFFELFPEIKNNPFYLFGESYAGKYISSIAYYLLKKNSTFRLDGIGIGNALIDPRNQEVYAANLYNLGIIDENTKREILRKESQIRKLIDKKKFLEASILRRKISRKHKPSTGYKHWYNYLESDYGKTFFSKYQAFLNLPSIRKAIHVENSTFQTDELVTKMLAGELMKSVRHLFEYVIERRRTLLYYGQMDLVVSYAGALNFIKKLNWSGAQTFKSAKRKFWEVKGKLAGYIKSEGMFTEVFVRNAGHSVPTDQPLWAFNLYNKFIFHKIGAVGFPGNPFNVTKNYG